MKKIRFITISAMICIIAISSSISADTIIDSVYADPVLDGYIMFRQSIQSFIINTWMYNMGAGDVGISMIEPDPNSRVRAYVSFELPEIPSGYELDSVYVRLYQYFCWGNDAEHLFPIWDVPGGDTMFCIMDHIDYGDELYVSDWTKGDPGDSGTLHTNIGIISDSAEVGYRYLDITTYVLDDYNNSRDKTQYRIRFPIETDWDSRSDLIDFKTTNSAAVNERPLIFLYFTQIISIEENTFPDVNNISVYPNPFTSYTRISYQLSPTVTEGVVEIYNLKGQLLRKLEFSPPAGGSNSELTTVWDGRDENDNVVSNGLYLIRIESKDVNVIKKVIKLN